MTVYSSYSEITSALTLLPGREPIQPRLFLLQPEVIFAARVNLPDPASYPVQYVAFDTVTTGAYTDIQPGMTICLGATAGGDEYGRQRVNDTATTISIFVGRSSKGTLDGELTVVDDAYITVWDDRRLWAKVPYIDSSGEVFKDNGLEVEDRTTEPPPVGVMGAGFAATVDADTEVITVTFNGQSSYTTESGATITDYLWDIVDGTLTSGTLADDNITATFPAGFRYVSLTVTDSNDKTHITYRPVFADDLEHSLSFDAFAIEAHSITDAGQTMTIRALEDMPRATYPDGTLAMIWDSEPGGSTNRDHMLIIGWLDSEDVDHSADRQGLLRNTTITILDVAARLNQLPGFPQTIADDDSRDTDLIPDITWGYMVSPTLDLYMHYLLQWHSTALEVADFVWSDTNDDYAFATWSSDGDSLWNQVARVAQAMCPDFCLTCDRAGRIAVVPDPMIQDLADRTATVQAAIDEDEWQSIRFTYQRAPKTHWLRSSALQVQTSVSFNTDGTIALVQLFAIAPGEAAGQGLSESETSEQLVQSQTPLNAATGHKYARLNNPLGLVSIVLIQDDGAAGSAVPWREIEPALKEWITINLGADYAAQRGLTFTTARALPKEISIRYNQTKTGLTRTITLTAEIETLGQSGATVVKPTVPAVGEQPEVVPAPIPPPDMGLIDGTELLAAIGEFDLYRTTDFQTVSGSGGPTWETVSLVEGDPIISWVVDPFSPGYLTGTGAINGYAATVNSIYRISDLFGTVIVNSLVEFDNTALWRTVQASFGTYFTTGNNPWLVCVSYYGVLGGHTGTWATYSLDGGTTWSDEVLVSAEYDSGGASNPIGLYCSPKTPGLAYTAAHIETATPAETSGFVSFDWGATWSEMAGEEDPERVIRWGLWPPDSGFALHGEGPRSSNTLRIDSSGTMINKTSYLVLAPPATAVRVTGRVEYTLETHRSSPFTSAASTTFNQAPTGVTVTKTNIVTPGGGYDVANDGSYDFEMTWSGSDWPEVNADTILSDPPATSDEGVRWYIQCIATGNGSYATGSLTVTITEIELADSTVYTPTFAAIVPIHGQAGEIHLPWEDNDAESIFYYGSLDRTGSPVIGLQRTDAGVGTDISETDFGINSGHFAVRAHDLDRQFVLLAGESGDGDAGVWVSIDGGDTWTEVVAPTATDPYQAAFGGDSELIVYIWGPAEYISFSDDMGVSLDDRSGNLGALSASKIIGIAGGPTA